MFEKISVNVQTGQVSYPSLPGFELDKERMYRTAEMFVPFCHGDVEMAVRQAIHQQLIAHQGMMSLERVR